VLIKRENAAPPGEYLSRITQASDIFSLEHTVFELMAYTKDHFVGTAAQNKLFDHAVKFIHSHLSEPLSLEVLSDHLHISASHLSRTFKKVCGESLTEYINHVRIEKAKEYLLRQDILAYEVADLVGYHDATYFSSIFKKYTGVSPTEYRQGALKSNTPQQ
jgi:two-component system response regulator YesN